MLRKCKEKHLPNKQINNNNNTIIQKPSEDVALMWLNLNDSSKKKKYMK